MIARILGGKSWPPPCSCVNQSWLCLFHHTSVLVYDLYISMTLGLQNGKAMKIKKDFCGLGHGWLTPLDSTGLQSSHDLSQFLLTSKVILVSPQSRRMFITHKGTSIFSDVMLKVMSSTWVRRKLICSLESSVHFMKHIHVWIRTTWLQLSEAWDHVHKHRI